ncbi:hypothetical protein [Natrononativus amylolyticus]|uniref:hypothetical protein n=1 Tax=Natrononativus amylolyticus TaxID=2963434 RepID=UPI0020CE7F3B|nr:hypothetical protein [Natrononativus amylolyticus]
MAELTMPADIDNEEAAERVRQFASVGDEVELYQEVMNLESENRLRGTLVDISPEHVTIETDDETNERLRPTEIDRMMLVSDE